LGGAAVAGNQRESPDTSSELSSDAFFVAMDDTVAAAAQGGAVNNRARLSPVSPDEVFASSSLSADSAHGAAELEALSPAGMQVRCALRV
jgi:hypothetical protein